MLVTLVRSRVVEHLFYKKAPDGDELHKGLFSGDRFIILRYKVIQTTPKFSDWIPVFTGMTEVKAIAYARLIFVYKNRSAPVVYSLVAS
jgi:hypothetical protein